MLLDNYLDSKKHNRKILVVADLGRSHDLVRKHEAKTWELVRNLVCVTMPQIVEAIYLYILSEKGFTVQDVLIDQTESMMLFRSIVFKNIETLKFFNNDKMMDLATTEEIFIKANLIRSNGWTGAENDEINDRISDLKIIISEYEQKLEAERYLDSIALLKTVISEMKKWKKPEIELKNIFSAEISCLKEDMDELTGLQKEFLSLIQNGQNSVVELYDRNPSAAVLDNCLSKAEFFKGYGSFNEASYIANDILSKKVSLGNVTVLYTSQIQVSSIKAALQGNGLAADFVSGYLAQNNSYISLARRIIAWAKDDFSEKYLEKILSSSVICAEVDDETGKKKNILASQKYFDHVLMGSKENIVLGWGYQRNIDFINKVTQSTLEGEVKARLKLHKELLEIFGEDNKPYDDKNMVRPSEVYKKLVKFLVDNTSSNEEYAIGMEAIKRLSGAINLEDRALPLKDILTFLDELLQSISAKDSASSNAISVQSISGNWVLLERPYVYVIGLSLKDMQGNTTESPVMSDDEMERYLGAGYKPTIRIIADLKEINLYRSLGTFDGQSIVFGFSSYDTVGFYESNPSSFFREALKRLSGAEVDQLPEFVYGNPTNAVDIALPVGLADKISYVIRYETSNSSMEVLLDCPKKYYYSKISRIPENTYTERDYSKWLDARLRGSFFHEIAEKYVDQMLIKPVTDSYALAADEDIIKKIAEIIKEKMLGEMPVAFEGLATRETNNLIEAAVSYLNRLHESLNNTGWRALFTEIRFDKASYKVKDYNSDNHEFIFSGIIDRIDYKADQGAKVIKLRIIDYKTGKKDSKSKENNLGKLLQYAVYEKALMETGHHTDDSGVDKMLLDVAKAKILELETIENIDDWKFEFDSFNYVFPMENRDFEPITIEAADIEGINIARLKCILTALKDKKTYPDHIELYEIVKEYETKYDTDSKLSVLSDNMDQTDKNGTVLGISDNETDHCKYCEYGDVCEHRKAGEM